MRWSPATLLMFPPVWLPMLNVMSPSPLAGRLPQWRHRKVAVEPLAPRCGDDVQNDPDDEQQHTQRGERPAQQPRRNAGDVPPEGRRQPPDVTAVADVARLLDRAH